MQDVLNKIEGQVDIESDVVFGTTGERDLLCDVYSPPIKSDNMPAILMLHGGSWHGGDRLQLKAYAIQLARYGCVCVCAEYRLVPEAIWPAQIHDVKAALRWMRANKDSLQIDPEKICVSGNSAGGHLALLLAGSSKAKELEGDGGHAEENTTIAAVCGIYAPAEIKVSHAPAVIGPLLGDKANTETELQASPSTYVNKDYPPTLLVQGNKDLLVPQESSLQMYQLLQDNSVAAELHMYDGMPHAFDVSRNYYRQISDIIFLFFERQAFNKREYQYPSM